MANTEDLPLPSDPVGMRPSVWEKSLEWLESSWFTLPVGILGGIVGVFLYAPVLIACGLCVILGFHKKKVVSGCDFWRVQIPVYLILYLVVSGALLGIHRGVQKELRAANISLTREIVGGIAKFFSGKLAVGGSDLGGAPAQVARQVPPPNKSPRAPEEPTPADLCDPKTADCTEDARGYLKTWPVKVWLDGWDVYADTLTANTGKLVVYPRALIIEHIEVCAPLTPQEQDEFFSKSGFGGGQAGVQWPTDNYWAPSDPPHLTPVIGPIPETSDDPLHPQIINNVNNFKGGNTVAYVFTRAFFRDKLGWMISESCTWYREPDLSQPHLCNGHNGPGKYPRN